MRKYYGITETINGNEYRVEIWDAPSGLATGGTQLNMGNPGFVIDYDGEGDKLWENPLRNSRINAYFVVSETTDHDFFQSLAVADEGKSAIVVYKNSNLFYVGRIIPDGMQYERRPEKNTVYQIAAVDGLNLLSKYKVDYDWFDSNTQRLDILKLVRESLKLTAIPDYYDHLGASADYMVDASKNFPTGEFDRLNVLEINLSSVINDLDEFMLQTTTGGTEVLYVDCKTAIERVLLLLHCRLIYTNGSFYIFDPVDYGSNYQNFGVKYSTNGTQGAKLSTLPQYTISNGTRPTFEAFPIHSHQPAVREIRQNYTREAFNRVVRNQASPNNQPITITTPSIGAVSGENRIFKVSSVLQYFTPITPQATKQKFIEISFRAYVTYSGGYKHYNYQTQSWDSGKTAVPGFEKIRAAVTGYEKFNSSYRLTIDFQREFQPPSAGDDVTVDISVGTMQWSWAAGQVFNPIFFTGVLCTYEIDNTNKSVIKTNDKYDISQDITVSDKAEFNIIYGYEYSGNTVNARGTIWNSSTNSASGILAGEWAQKQLACYIDAPKTASATLVDDGDYYPILSPQFDSDSYIFSGGSFTAQDETWEFELLKVEEDVENVNSDELDYQDTIGGSNQQKDAVRRVLNQTNTLRDSVSSFDTTLPTDIIRLSDDSPTSTPTYDTLFTPYVKYDATDEDIVWSAREEGKSKTITSSETFDDTVSFYQIDTGLNTVQLTLPLPSTVKGKEFTFKKTSPANTVELAGTIDGGTGYFMDYNNETVVLVSDGSEYIIKAEYGKDDLTDVTDRDNTTDNTVGVGALQLNLTPTATPTEGMLYWDEDEETAAVQVNGINYEIGQGLFWVAKNQTGVQIDKGTAVYASGTLGSSGRLLISPMIADGTIQAKYFLGITAEDIANGDDGKVITQGKLRQLDTSAFTAGNVLWVSASTAGDLTSTQPTGTNDIALVVAFVVDASTNGMIAVRVSNLDENDITDIPTLDEVTTEGNTTTNDIEVGGLNVDSGTLYVDSTNNRVGIGTSSPAQKLHVSGQVIVDGGTGVASSGVLHVRQNGNGSDNGIAITSGNATSHRIWKDSSGGLNIGPSSDPDAFYQDLSGNIGIGTSSPTSTTLLHISAPQSGAASGTGLTISGWNGSAESRVQFMSYGIGGGTFALRTGTSNTERLRIDSSGNLGVGTSSPARTLHVKKTGDNEVARFESDQTTSYIELEDANTTGQILIGTQGDNFKIHTAGSERLRVTGGGNVLIGTTSDAGYKLRVAGSALFTNWVRVNGSDGIYFQDRGGGWRMTDTTWLRSYNDKSIYTGGGAYFGSNVGIGTSSPNHKLDIYSNENVPLRIHRPSNANLNSSGAWGIGFSTRGDANTSTSDTRAGIFSYYNGNLFIATSTSDVVADPDASARLTVTSAGAVGIGTMSPSESLEVAGNIQASGSRFIRAEYDSNHYMQLESNSSGGILKGLDGGTTTVLVRSYGDSYFNGGSFGIGQSSPTARLEVIGTIKQKTGSGYANYVQQSVSEAQITFSTYSNNQTNHPSAIKFSPNGTEAVRIDNDGNLGVGTSSPDTLLHLESTSSGSSPILTVENDNDIKLKLGAVRSLAGTAPDTTFIAYDSSLRFIADADSTTEVARISSGGNLLIGTTTDNTQKLQVNGTSRFDDTMYVSEYIAHLGDGNTAVRFLDDALQFNAGGVAMMKLTEGSADVVTINPDSADVNFQVNGDTVANLLFVDAGTSRVGIGTSSPGEKLEVYDGNIKLNDGTRNLLVGEEGSSSYQIKSSGYLIIDATSGIQINKTTSGNVSIASGNVLIGTTTDNGYKLNVNGDATINGVRVGRGAGNVDGNTVVGSGAFNSNSTGLQNTAIGYQSLRNNTGLYNTALGFQSAYSNTTGERNTAVGRQALRANSTGSYNVALGMDALNNNTASNNTALGYQAAYSNTSGNIVAIGWQAGFANTTGTITAIGYQALKANTTGSENVAIGRESMRLATASNNTAVGTYSGYVLTTGSGNTMVGRRSLFTATTANYNTALGYQALKNNATSSSNTAVGLNSLVNTTGNSNTAIGTYAGDANTTGSNNIFIGFDSEGVSLTDSNRTFIGNSSTTSTWVGGNLLVGTTTDSGYKLNVNGTAYASEFDLPSGGQLDWANGDARIKEGDVSNYSLSFQTYTGSALTTKMFISGSGNIGLGTTSPSQLLHLSRTGTNPYIRISSDSFTGLDIGQETSAGNGVINLRDNKDIRILTNGTDVVRIKNTGYVGIGNTSPDTNLHINGTGATASGNQYHLIVGDDNSYGINKGGGIIFRGDYNSSGAQANFGAIRAGKSNANDGNANAYLSLMYGASGVLTEGLRVNYNGNILIGTTTDSGAKLDVKVSGASLTNVIKFGDATPGYLASGTSGVYLSDSSGTARFMFKHTGEVGIGTSSPSANLHIAGGVTILGQNKIDGSSDNLKIMSDYANVSGNSTIEFSVDNSEKMRITNGGNVGINTTSPSSKLHVVGDFFLKGSDTSSSTKNFQVQTGNGTSIMDFRNDAYAFFGCGQGGGSASGFIFRYNSTFGVQFTGYNYGNGTSPSYKPILMDTDLAGRSQGVYVNYGITGYTAPAPTTTAEFAVRGRGTSSSFTAKFEDSSTNPLLYIKDNGNVMIGTGTDSGYKLDVEGDTNTNGDYYVNGTQGWSGTITINTNPQVSITVEGGIITNVT